MTWILCFHINQMINRTRIAMTWGQIHIQAHTSCPYEHRSHFGSRYHIWLMRIASLFTFFASWGFRRQKRRQHPKGFPGGPPPQYWPGPATVNFGVRKRSGVFVAVWPLANYIVQTLNSCPKAICFTCYLLNDHLLFWKTTVDPSMLSIYLPWVSYGNLKPL